MESSWETSETMGASRFEHWRGDSGNRDMATVVHAPDRHRALAFVKVRDGEDVGRLERDVRVDQSIEGFDLVKGSENKACVSNGPFQAVSLHTEVAQQDGGTGLEEVSNMLGMPTGCESQGNEFSVLISNAVGCICR